MKKHGVAVLFDLNPNFPPSSRVWTSAFVKQSASFALATTHSLDVLFNASRPYRRSPSAYFEGTHGVRSAWGNTDAIDFVAIASSLQATNGRRAVGNTNRLKAVPLRFVRQLRTQTAQSLVLSIKLGAPFLAALRLAFRLVRLFAKLAFINDGFCSVPQ